MTSEKELLEHIVKSTEMGIDGIKNILSKAVEKELREELKSESAEYEAIRRDAYTMLSERGEEAKGLGAFAKISSELMTEMETAFDCSSSKLSDMMIKGTTMGVTKSTKLLSSYDGKDEKIRGLCEKLLALEEKRIEKLKQFL